VATPEKVIDRRFKRHPRGFTQLDIFMGQINRDADNPPDSTVQSV